MMAQGDNPPQIKYLLDELGRELTLKEALDQVYTFLLPRYRNEYIFRNEIINSIYDSRHDLSVAHMFCEFAVGRSRTDLAVINGTSTCYEIKTDIDTLRRLEGQITDYTRFFDKVFVAVSEDRLKQAREILDENIGILVFDNDKQLWEARVALSNIDRIDPIMIFNSLHQNEQISIAKRYNSEIAHLNAVEGYFAAKDIFGSFSSHQVHIEFMTTIKSRRSQRVDRQFDQLPKALAGAYLATKMTKRMWNELITRLHSPLKE